MNAITWMNILTGVVAILGVVFGIAGFVLGVLNYLRDRPKIKINLQWNLQTFGPGLSQNEPECGLITVTNTGRRPIYISHVCLILPKTYKSRVALLLDSVSGQKLSEGDQPARFIIRNDIQNKYTKDLKRIRAQVSDSTGQVYTSKYPTIQKSAVNKVS
jgi:hypothetical protein